MEEQIAGRVAPRPGECPGARGTHSANLPEGSVEIQGPSPQ